MNVEVDEYGWQEPPWCPIPGCVRRRRGEMCKQHWSRVPAHLQSDVWRAWSTWRADFGAAARMRAYRDAVEIARMAVEPRTYAE